MRVSLLVLTAQLISAQFAEFRPLRDGFVFSTGSGLRLRGTEFPGRVTYSPGAGFVPYRIPSGRQDLTLSRDGEVAASVSVTQQRIPRPGSLSSFDVIITTRTFVSGFGPVAQELNGKAQVSGNGQWLAVEVPQSATVPPRVQRRKRGGAEEWISDLRVLGSRDQAIADDGAVVSGQGGRLTVDGTGGRREFDVPGSIVEARISPRGTHVVYAYQNPFGLASIDISTGVRTVIRESSRPEARTYFYLGARDGAVAFLNPADKQIWLADADGRRARRITRPEAHPGGFTQLALSVEERSVYAATAANEIVEIDCATQALRILVPKTPIIAPGLRSAPGSLVEWRGGGITAVPHLANQTPLPEELGGVTVRWNGRAMPIAAVEPGRILFQVPWESARTGAPLRIEGPGEGSPFEHYGNPSLEVVARAPAFFGESIRPDLLHQGFDRFVTAKDPARKGEYVHLYAMGLGPVEGEVRTGMATKAWQPLLGPWNCSLRWGAVPAESWAGLAPGLVGVYQITLRIPETADSGVHPVLCDTDSSRLGFEVPVE